MPFAPGGQWADSAFVTAAGTYRAIMLYATDSAEAANKQSVSNTFVVTQ
jgi:hypothetical protein